MIVDFSGYSYDWTPIIPAAIITGIVVLVYTFLVLMGLNAWGWDSDVLGPITVVTVMVGAIVLGVFGFMQTDSANDSRKVAYQESQIEKLGFTEVDLGGDEFVASYKGEYFRGGLFLLEGGKYQIVEVPVQ